MNRTIIGAVGLALVCGQGCGSRQPPAPAPAALVVEGFNSRETAGEEPIFDLSAAEARVVSSVIASSARDQRSGEVIDIRDVRFILFQNGAQSGRISADSGFFSPADKSVELHGRVTYTSVQDSLSLRAGRMSWNPRTSILRCDQAVEGSFRQFQFSADQMLLPRDRSVFHLQRATFSGPA